MLLLNLIIYTHYCGVEPWNLCECTMPNESITAELGSIHQFLMSTSCAAPAVCVLRMHNETQHTLTGPSRISEVRPVKQISFFEMNHARINTQWSKEVISRWRENETHTHHYHGTFTKNLISALTKGRINHLREENLNENFMFLNNLHLIFTAFFIIPIGHDHIQLTLRFVQCNRWWSLSTAIIFIYTTALFQVKPRTLQETDVAKRIKMEEALRRTWTTEPTSGSADLWYKWVMEEYAIIITQTTTIASPERRVDGVVKTTGS